MANLQHTLTLMRLREGHQVQELLLNRTEELHLLLLVHTNQGQLRPHTRDNPCVRVNNNLLRPPQQPTTATTLKPRVPQQPTQPANPQQLIQQGSLQRPKQHTTGTTTTSQRQQEQQDRRVHRVPTSLQAQQVQQQVHSTCSHRRRTHRDNREGPRRHTQEGVDPHRWEGPHTHRTDSPSAPPVSGNTGSLMYAHEKDPDELLGKTEGR